MISVVIIRGVILAVLFEEYTIELTVDELYLCLMKANDNRYEKQARNLMYIIPIHRPAPYFTIKIVDISQQVQKELHDRWNYKDEIDYILKEAVGRIFRNLNENYFLLSVKPLLKVRLIE
jgi:hypothetical protein